MSERAAPGQRVTWNETGRDLFGDTGSTGLLVDVTDELGHILWESGQETWASLSCLEPVDAGGSR